MKKYIYLFSVVFLILLSANMQAQTTVQAGDWSSPATWGGAPPMGTGTVVINHAVTLDTDYSHTSGSITIGAAGSVSSTNPMRFFALNYPSGNASLTVNGLLSVARVPISTGVVINTGTFEIDSLLNTANLNNNSGGTINAEQFMTNIGGELVNNGNIVSINFLNVDTVTNNGTISTSDFCNSKNFINGVNGIVNVGHDFSNIDTLSTPVVLTNDGQFLVSNNWLNTELIDGSGTFCIVNNTSNTGTMSGTFDFCDQSGGNIDDNSGSIAGTITYCTSACNVSIEDLSTTVSLYPNPCNTEAILFSNRELNNATVVMHNIFGQEVLMQSNLSGQELRINCSNLNSGVYSISVLEGNQVVATAILNVQ